MRDNRHMNLFEHYTQKDAIPHENNLSRALAILFDSEPLLLDRFIRLVNEKLRVMCPNVCLINPPTRREAMNVGFQQRASDLVEDSSLRIICLTLTPDKSDFFSASVPAAAQSGGDLITDISLASEDDLLLVEVKRQSAAPAGAQVTAQAQNICKLLGQDGEKNPPQIIDPVNITWSELIDVLEDVHDLQGKDERSPLGHYLQYLNSHCQDWFSVTPFRAFANDERTPVRTRLQNLAENCGWLICRPSDGKPAPADWTGESAVVPADLGFAREFHLSAEWDGPKFKGVKALFWPGNNNAQSRFLFTSPRVSDDMAWTKDESLTTPKGAVKCAVTPYVKFSHVMGHYVMSAYCLPDAADADRQEIWQKLAEPLNGKWERSKWQELKEFLTGNPKLLKDPESFRTFFGRHFENGGKKFAFVTFGYEVVLTFPVADLEKYEAESKFEPDKDKTAERIVSAVKAMKDKIEGKK